MEYERFLLETLRLGHYLAGPAGRTLPPERWDAHFERYRHQLQQLKELRGEEPATGMLAGRQLRAEILDVFAP